VTFATAGRSLSRIAVATRYSIPVVADCVDRAEPAEELPLWVRTERLLALQELREIGVIDANELAGATALLLGMRPTSCVNPLEPHERPAGHSAAAREKSALRPFVRRKHELLRSWGRRDVAAPMADSR